MPSFTRARHPHCAHRSRRQPKPRLQPHREHSGRQRAHRIHSRIGMRGLVSLPLPLCSGFVPRAVPSHPSASAQATWDCAVPVPTETPRQTHRAVQDSAAHRNPFILLPRVGAALRCLPTRAASQKPKKRPKQRERPDRELGRERPQGRGSRTECVARGTRGGRRMCSG